MYYASSTREVCDKFRSFGVDPDKSYRKGDITVIGATNDSTYASQLWIDSKSCRVMRLMKFDNGHKSDALFSGHKKAGRAPCETLVEFYEDGKLRQKEVYTRLRANKRIPASMFSVNDPWSWHWLK